eukprot:17835-Alexandrium_andersonii.AAC.1
MQGASRPLLLDSASNNHCYSLHGGMMLAVHINVSSHAGGNLMASVDTPRHESHSGVDVTGGIRC